MSDLEHRFSAQTQRDSYEIHCVRSLAKQAVICITQVCAACDFHSRFALLVKLSHYDIFHDNVISRRYVMYEETRLKVNENGRVVIPAQFRKALGIKTGDEVILRMEEDELRITTTHKRIERAQKLVRKYIKPGVSLVDELIADRRRGAKDE